MQKSSISKKRLQTNKYSGSKLAKNVKLRRIKSAKEDRNQRLRKASRQTLKEETVGNSRTTPKTARRASRTLKKARRQRGQRRVGGAKRKRQKQRGRKN